jgi:hypothetical protein
MSLTLAYAETGCGRTFHGRLVIELDPR